MLPQHSLTKTCERCGRLFVKKENRDLRSWERARFCSQPCCYAARGQVGAWNKGKVGIYSEATIQKMRERRRGLAPWNRGLTKETDTRVAQYALTNTGIPNTPAQIEASRQATKTLWQNPSWASLQIEARNRPEFIERQRQRMLGENNPFRGKAPWNKGKTRCYSEETRKQMGADKVGKSSAMKGRHFPPEVVEKNSQAQKKNWQKPEYVAKQMRARGVRPNRVEMRLEQELLLYGFSYVGDGQLIIGGKCPDFWNGDHKLIELFGDYWHRGDDPEDRIKHFRDAGYDCLVIWERELQVKAVIKAKVHAFSES